MTQQVQVDGHMHYLTFKIPTCKPIGNFVSLTTTAHDTTQLQNEPSSGQYEKKDFATSINRYHNSLALFRDKLLNTPLQAVVFYWRDHVRIKLQSTFKQEINLMVKRAIFPATRLDGKPFSIAVFKRIRHHEALGWINKQSDWSEAMKDQIIGCYKALVTWLNKLSPNDFDPYQLESTSCFSSLGVNSAVLPSSGTIKFFCSHTLPKVATTFSDWRNFIEALGKKNRRDALIARSLIQGQKRLSEVLNLKIEHLNFEKNSIRYISKKKDEEIHYDSSFMEELKEYIESVSVMIKNEPYVFITRTGKPLTPRRMNYSCTHICTRNGIKGITPDSLRRLWSIFKQEKQTDRAIMQSEEARIEESNKKWQKKMEDMLNPEISK